jgi:hypothetical protein
MHRRFKEAAKRLDKALLPEGLSKKGVTMLESLYELSPNEMLQFLYPKGLLAVEAPQRQENASEPQDNEPPEGLYPKGLSNRKTLRPGSTEKTIGTSGPNGTRLTEDIHEARKSWKEGGGNSG